MNTGAAFVYDCRQEPPKELTGKTYQARKGQKPIDTIREAIERYFDKFEVLPTVIIAHPALAEAVGGEVDGIEIHKWDLSTGAPILHRGECWLGVPGAGR